MTRTSIRLSAGFATTTLLLGGAALFASGPADATVQLGRPGTVQLIKSDTVQLGTVQLGTVQLGKTDTVQLGKTSTVQLTVQL